MGGSFRPATTTTILCTCASCNIPIRFCDIANELSYRDRMVIQSPCPAACQPMHSTFLERRRRAGRRLTS
ncbi:hypothetical protein FZI91_15605 [Mycobacterium sp. CBMA271]|nr:hypothetical protein [Mycobacteroides sp. CBMA 271]